MALRYPEAFRASGHLETRSHVKKVICLQGLGETLRLANGQLLRFLSTLPLMEIPLNSLMLRLLEKSKAGSLAALAPAVSTLQTSSGKYLGASRQPTYDVLDENVTWRCGRAVGEVDFDSEIAAKPLVRTG